MGKLQQSALDKISKFNAGQIKMVSVDNPSKSEVQNWNSFTFGIDENNNILYIRGKGKSFTLNLTEF